MKRRVRRTTTLLIHECWMMIWACTCPNCTDEGLSAAGVTHPQPCHNPQCDRRIQVIERSLVVPIQKIELQNKGE